MLGQLTFNNLGIGMNMLTLARTLLYRGGDDNLTRYEIYKNSDNPSDNIDSIYVYREKLIGDDLTWVKTNDKVSLDHLGPEKGGSFQQAVSMYMRAPRDISSAIDECHKHWLQTYK